MAGETEAARRVLRDLEVLQGSNKGAATQLAILYGLLGETDRAFACLEEAYRYRQPLLLLANVQPRMDCLRSDPRLHDLLRRLNLLKPVSGLRSVFPAPPPVSHRRRFLCAKAIYVWAVARCRRKQYFFLIHPIGPQSWLFKPVAKSLAASCEVFGNSGVAMPPLPTIHIATASAFMNPNRMSVVRQRFVAGSEPLCGAHSAESEFLHKSVILLPPNR